MSGQKTFGRNGMGPLPTWDDLEPVAPQLVATMRRYLAQIGCVLRPGSVGGADLALRSFAGFLTETAPEVSSTAAVTRAHIEDYKPWLAQRPGQNKARLTTATIVHRLGTLRMFFVRLDGAAHRVTGRRVHRAALRRGRADRSRPVAARAGRQVARGPS